MNKNPVVDANSNDLSELLFDNVNIVTLILDPETGSVKYANPAACKFYGYSYNELISMNISQINPKPLGETLIDLKMAFSGERDYYKTTHKISTGEIRFVGIYTGKIKLHNRSLLLEMIHDSTNQMKTEENLQSLSMAVEQSPVSIVVTDITGKIEYVNPKFTEVTGYTRDEALGKDPRILKTGEGGRQEIRELWQTVLSGETWTGEFCNRKKNGDIYWESASISPVFNENGKIVHIVAVKEDITEKRQTQIRIADALRFNQAILDTSPIGINIYKASGQCVLANPAAGVILGASPEKLMSQNFRDLASWKKYGLLDLANEAIEKKEPVSSEFYFVSTFGKEIWMDMICAPFISGGELNILILFEDFSTRKKAELELKTATEKMELWVRRLEKRDKNASLLQDMTEMLQVSTSVSEAYSVFHQYGLQLFPESRGGLFTIGQVPDMVELTAGWGDPVSCETIFSINECWALRRNQAFLVPNKSSKIKCGHLSKDFSGGYVDIPMTASGDLIGLLHIEWPAGLADDDGIMELSQNVSEIFAFSLSNIKLRETLRNQSIRDPLTGVFNRRYMEETLEREIPRARRKKTTLGLLMIDIDHFKKFNDSYGHDAGDHVLKTLSSMFQSKVRCEDIVCRFGGEEFVIILPEANLHVTRDRAEDIRQAICTLDLAYDGKPLGQVTISIGVAIYPDHGTSGNDIIVRADKALYQAKTEGRNRVITA